VSAHGGRWCAMTHRAPLLLAAAVLVLCVSASWAVHHGPASWAGHLRPARGGQQRGAGAFGCLPPSTRPLGVLLAPQRALALRGGGTDEGTGGDPPGGFGQVHTRAFARALSLARSLARSYASVCLPVCLRK
jgi:hypothetical protein